MGALARKRRLFHFAQQRVHFLEPEATARTHAGVASQGAEHMAQAIFQRRSGFVRRQVVGQIAKLAGCRAVGIAGGPEKCRYVVDELGFDACVDYKAGNSRDALKAACPKGVDVYFDNVGGEILDMVLARISRKARIVICGAISQYNNEGAVQGPKNYLSLLVNRARMEGMVVFDYTERFPQAVAELAGYLREGRMHSREDVVDGLKNFPEALLKLFSGANFGKLILRVATA